MMDGNVKSVKLYAMLALGVACFTFLWFDKMNDTTVALMLVPTLIAWLKLHVDQQKAKLKSGGSS